MFLLCKEPMEVDQTKPVHDQITYQQYKKKQAKDFRKYTIFTQFRKKKKHGLLGPKLMTLIGSPKFDEVLLALTAQTRTQV